MEVQMVMFLTVLLCSGVVKAQVEDEDADLTPILTPLTPIVVEGSSVTFTCRHPTYVTTKKKQKLEMLFDISWQRDALTLALWLGKKEWDCLSIDVGRVSASQYSYSCPRRTAFTWTINNVSRSDNNTMWYCTLMRSLNTTTIQHYTATALLQVRMKAKGPVMSEVAPQIEGPYNRTVALATCTMFDFWPAEGASIEWTFGTESMVFEGSPILNTSTNTYTLSHVFRRKVDRTDQGKELKCSIRQEHVTTDGPISQSIALSVLYPPDVTMVTESLTHDTLLLRCDAHGHPDVYTYIKWTLEWPGYGVVKEWPDAGAGLNISQLSYEYSGIYTCFVSNGITNYKTGLNYKTATDTVLVKSKPKIIHPIRSTQSNASVNVMPTSRQSVSVLFYVTSGSATIQAYRVLNHTRQGHALGYATFTETMVTLDVFSHKINTSGTQATLTIPEVGDGAVYDIVVSNENGADVIRISIDNIETDEESGVDTILVVAVVFGVFLVACVLVLSMVRVFLRANKGNLGCCKTVDDTGSIERHYNSLTDVRERRVSLVLVENANRGQNGAACSKCGGHNWDGTCVKCHAYVNTALDKEPSAPVAIDSPAPPYCNLDTKADGRTNAVKSAHTRTRYLTIDDISPNQVNPQTTNLVTSYYNIT